MLRAKQTKQCIYQSEIEMIKRGSSFPGNMHNYYYSTSCLLQIMFDLFQTNQSLLLLIKYAGTSLKVIILIDCRTVNLIHHIDTWVQWPLGPHCKCWPILTKCEIGKHNNLLCDLRSCRLHDPEGTSVDCHNSLSLLQYIT